MTPDPSRPDLALLAGWFAAAVAKRQDDHADAWADAYFRVARGEFLEFPRDDGGCEVLTRAGRRCRNRAAPGMTICRVHDDLIALHELRQESAP